jgi:hypothetical protein
MPLAPVSFVHTRECFRTRATRGGNASNYLAFRIHPPVFPLSWWRNFRASHRAEPYPQHTMDKPNRTKSIPSRAKFLTYANFSPTGSTLERLIGLITIYTNIRPILAGYSVGPLVPDLDLLGADLNDHWQLQGGRRFFQGEIDPSWTVRYLAAYIDLKRAK